MTNTKKNGNIIALFNILSTIILQGLAFFSTPYFSRVLGTANYGIVSVFNTWVRLITIVFFVCMHVGIAMGISEFREDEQSSYQSSILSLSMIIFMILSCITMAIVAWYKSSYLLFVGIMLIQGFGSYAVSFANSKFTYEFRADINFFMSIGISIATIVLSTILIRNWSVEENYWGRIYGVTIPYAIIGIYIVCYILIKGKQFVNIRYWRFALPLAIPTVFHSLAHIVLNQSDRMMLQVMRSNSVAGIYSLAYTFSNVLHICWTALNNTWVPIYYDNTKANKVEVIKKQTKNYLELFTAICVVFMMMAPEVYKIFASDDYLSHTNLIPIFAIACYFIFLYSFFINYEIYYKQTKIIAVASSAAAIINIILNFFLIRPWGAYGAAIATLISYFLLFLSHSYTAKRIVSEIEMPFSIRSFVPYIIIVLAIGVWGASELYVYMRWIFAILIIFIEAYRVIKRKTIF